jgi:Reverse transcriptase (RNA-dependent DNA polymerase)
MDISSLQKKRPVETLTYENWEQWFDLFGDWAKGEGIDFVLRKTVIEYCYTFSVPSISGTTLTSSESSSLSVRPLEIQDLLESMNIQEETPLLGEWNLARLEKYAKAESKVRYTLMICVDDIDGKLIKDCGSVRTGWQTIWTKYSVIRPATSREEQIKLTNYQWEENQTIDNAWIEIKSLRRKVVRSNPKLDKAYDDNMLLQFLMPALPEDYAVTVATLDAQPNLTVLDKLVALRNREDVLRTIKNVEDKALAAKQSAVPKQADIKCLFCNKSRSHSTDECEFQKRFNEVIEGIVRKEAKRTWAKKKHNSNSKNETKSKSYSKGSSRTNYKDKDKKKNKSVKFEKGHAATNESTDDSTEDYTTTSSESTEDELVEYANLTRDELRTIPHSHWCSDSCASSHMTDDKSLFRSQLTPIRRRTILVGGGQLYADFIGTAELKVKGSGSVLLSDVLYVPNLGVNLLSSRKLCRSKGLKFTGDDNRMAFWHNRTKILEASVKGGVYIISWVKPDLINAAFNAVERTKYIQTIVDSTDTTEVELASYGGQNDQNVQFEEECSHLDFDHAFLGDANYLDTDETAKTSKKDLDQYRLWHERCVHAGPEVIRNLHLRTTLSKVKVPNEREACITCKLAKLRKKMSKELSPWKETVLALVYADIAGPFHTSLQGNRYMAKLVDSASRYTWVITGKDRKDIVRCLQNWKKVVERETDLKIMSVRIDNATELKALLKEWLTLDGVREEDTVPYSSFQNGPAERSIQTTEHDFRAMLKGQGLPLEFWDEAVSTGAYVRNRIMNGPISGDKTFTPYEAYYGEMPKIDHFRKFGCQAVGYIDPKSLPANERNPKQVDKGRHGVFMGYVDRTNRQWRLYAPDLGRTITVTTIEFLESEKGGDLDLRIRGARPQGTSSEPVVRNSLGRPKETLTTVELPPKHKLNNFEIRIPSHRTDDTTESVHGTDSMESNHDRTKSKEGVNSTPKVNQDLKPILQPFEARKFFPSLAGSKRPLTSSYDDDNSGENRLSKIRKITAFLAKASKVKTISDMDALEMGFAAAILEKGDVEVNVPIPRSYEAAINDAVYGEQWRTAIQEELKALKINGTWKEEIPPKGTNLVSTKWVFTVKIKNDGTLDRFKARLVARGFSQLYGVDYFETFAPTVRMDTLRIFLAIAAMKDLELIHMDVKNAFTESPLKEKIYLKPPKGVQVTSGYALRVLRSLYGLKQAARDWNLLCRDQLRTMGFKQSLSDPCLFIHSVRNIQLLIYVDDLLCATDDKASSDWVYSELSKRFTIKNLGPVSKLLGIRITRNRRTRELWLDQEQYLVQVLKKFGMETAKYKKRGTPMRDYEKLRPRQLYEERHDVNEYQQVVGSLMYAMVHTRPDLAFALGKLSQYMQDPSESHWTYLKALLRYVRSSVGLQLRFGPRTNSTESSYDRTKSKLTVYTDADWAGQKSDRKSTSGGVAMLYSGPIYWISKVQRSVATSSTESEYIAQSTNAKASQWLAQILQDMKCPELIGKIVRMLADNQGAIALAKNPHLHDRSRHIDIKYHHVRNLVESRKLKIKYIPTAEMTADGFTKPLDRTKFDMFKDHLGMDTRPEDV